MSAPAPQEKLVEYTPVFARTAASNRRIVVNVGGARSSKSYSIAQLLNYRLLSEPKKEIIVTRKTMPALKATAMADIVGILRDWGVYHRLEHNKTDHMIRCPWTDSLLRFTSIEDPTRIRSMKASYIWMEEANEFNYPDYLTLKTRLSAPSLDGKRNQMFLSLNPSDAYGWVNQRLCNAARDEADSDKSDVEVIYSSYRDNPFLDADYIETLESLKEEDETYYLIFTKGVWAQAGSIIYSNYDIVTPETFPEFAAFDEAIGGLDFGFNNPASATMIGMKDGEAWIREIVYKSKLTNAQLIEKVKENCPQWRRMMWRADEAEPDRIEEFKSEGFRIEAAPKGKNSLRDGIDFCQRIKMHISDDSTNIIKEIRGYKWKEQDGIVMDDPVKYMDHSMDSIRYGLTALKGYSDPQARKGTPGGRSGVRKLNRVGSASRYGRGRY